MKNNDYFARYHAYFDHLLTEYFESGRYEAVIRQTQAMIAPYVQADPTAFCSYEDHLLAVDTLLEVCRLRSESVRGQLEGDYPATLAQWAERPVFGVDASHVNLRAWGISMTWRRQGSGRMRPRRWWSDAGKEHGMSFRTDPRQFGA